MEISINRSPQHGCPSEGSNSELFAHENDALTTRPQHRLQKSYARSSGVILCSFKSNERTLVLTKLSHITQKIKSMLNCQNKAHWKWK